MLRRSFLGAAAAAGAASFLPARPALAQSARRRTLRFVPQADVTILDPLTTSAYVTRNHALLVFDQLFAIDGDLRPQPQMVEGHTVEDDGKRWTFRLREGLRFHDGEPVRGRDCVASIRRWAPRDNLGQLLLARTDAMEALDDRTFDGASVSFRVKDYRRDEAGRPRVMTLSAAEFIRRFLLHVLPRGFHRIRHYGFLTGSNRTAGLDRIRAVLGVPAPPRPSADAPDPQDSPGQARPPCPCCGGPMTIVGSFAGWHQPRGPPFRSTSHRAGSP